MWGEEAVLCFILADVFEDTALLRPEPQVCSRRWPNLPEVFVSLFQYRKSDRIQVLEFLGCVVIFNSSQIFFNILIPVKEIYYTMTCYIYIEFLGCAFLNSILLRDVLPIEFSFHVSMFSLTFGFTMQNSLRGVKVRFEVFFPENWRNLLE